MKTDILPESCRVERALQRHCQSTRQSWDDTELGQWGGETRTVETFTSTKLSAVKCETQNISPKWMPTAWSVVEYGGECDSFLRKGTKWSISRHISIQKKVFRLCHNICWSSKTASDIQNRCRCRVQQLSFEVMQMVLGKGSGMVGQGSGEASCEHTAATGCRGHGHDASTCRQGEHWVSERDSSWPKLQLLWGKHTILAGSYTRGICSCDEGTQDPRIHCQIDSSQFTLHPRLLT